MNEKSLEDMFTSALMKESANKIQEVVNERLDSLETQLINKINKCESKLKEKVESFEQDLNSKPISVNFGTLEVPKNKLVHSSFETILKVLQSGKRINKNIMLVGPAGSSKSTTCSQVAEALNLDFYFMSVGLQTTKSDLIGFINAKGDYMTTPIRKAFEEGGLLLLDEFDATHSGVITILNSMLANDVCSFPDKIVKKHENFVCMVACNTYGKGGSIDYIGRNRLDGATLDRFVVVNMDYDDRLEEKLTNHSLWIKAIRKMRKNIEKQGLKIIVSPRASMQGADLLDAGFKIEEVLEMVIFKGASKDVRSKIIQDIDLGKFNKAKETANTTKKEKADKEKPIDVCIDFNTGIYSVTNIIEGTSIISNVDWQGSFSIYISSQSDWEEMITHNDIYLNFGKDRQIDCKDARKTINKFITEMSMYCSTILTELQDIHFKITYEDTLYEFRTGEI